MNLKVNSNQIRMICIHSGLNIFRSSTNIERMISFLKHSLACKYHKNIDSSKKGNSQHKSNTYNLRGSRIKKHCKSPKNKLDSLSNCPNINRKLCYLNIKDSHSHRADIPHLQQRILHCILYSLNYKYHNLQGMNSSEYTVLSD